MPDRKTIALPHGKIDVMTAGSGPALVVLPHESGFHGWDPFLERLSQSRCVIALSPPGFDRSERPEWLRSVIDLAALVGQAIDALGVTPAAILGLGFGGWVAAELAARGPQRAKQLLLHAPMGVKPPVGEIVDQFLLGAAAYVELGFTSAEAFGAAMPSGPDAHIERWEDNREMTTRIAWKPYMYDPALPHLLRGLRIPTLVTWCEGDRIVPQSCAGAYCEAIPAAIYRELAQGGHLADMEVPDALATIFLDQLTAWTDGPGAVASIRIAR